MRIAGMVEIRVAPAVRQLGIFAASIRCSWRECGGNGETVLDDVSKMIKGAYSLSDLRKHRIFRAYRDVMWRLGIDPTKIRPSSEALVRRVLRGKRVRSIHPVVDACNAASMRWFIVISVFDASRVRPPLTLRFARRGEVFEDFSGKARVLSGKEVVLADSEDRILHLYPYRDSAIAAVRDDTREVVAVAYGAPGLGAGYPAKALEVFMEILSGLCSGVTCSDIDVSR